MPGRDLIGLPRYPGSTRVEYRHERLKNLARTRAEYATSADPDEVRTFYRDTFSSRGWMVADLSFSPEEWYFFVVRDKREALVEIHALREPVVVEIELTGPGADETSANETPASPPIRTTPGPPPVIFEDDDGEDDEDAKEIDDYYEGGDD